MPVQASVIPETRPPSSRASMPAQEKSAARTMSYRTKSVRFAARMHSAVRDRRNRNRDGARRRCNKVRRESSRSDESSAGGRSERQQRDRQRFLSLADDLLSLLSWGSM